MFKNFVCSSAKATPCSFEYKQQCVRYNSRRLSEYLIPHQADTLDSSSDMFQLKPL